MVETTKKKMAIVVIHGIGEQKPFETLDAFALGLRTEYQNMINSQISLEHNIIWCKDWGESYISLVPKDSANYRQIDVIEYYWSHMTQRKITSPQIMQWISKVTRNAMAYYKKYPTEYSDKLLFVQDNELNRSEYFAQTLGLEGWYKKVFKVLLFLIDHIWLWKLYKSIGSSLLDVTENIPFLGVIKKIIGWLSKLPKLIVKLASKPIVDYIGDIALYCTSDLKSEHYDTRIQILDSATNKVKWLAICKETDNGKETEKDRFDEILVCGHSLGSVVAHNVINRLDQEMLCGTEIPISKSSKFKGIVTFGSPLDKVAFFFDEHVDEKKQPIRHAVISDLQGFRRKDTGCAFIGEGFDQAVNVKNNTSKGPLSQIPWLNFWMEEDKISGPLERYSIKKDNNAVLEFSRDHKWLPIPDDEKLSLTKKVLSKLTPGLSNCVESHNEYWKTKGFYTRIINQFILDGNTTKENK